MHHRFFSIDGVFGSAGCCVGGARNGGVCALFYHGFSGSSGFFNVANIGSVTVGGAAACDVGDWFIACSDASFGDAWATGDGNTIVIYSCVASLQTTCSTQINVLCKFQAQGIAGFVSHYTNIIISKYASCTTFNVERTTKFTFYGCATITVKFERISRLNSHLIKLTAINSIGGSSRNFTRCNVFDLALITYSTYRNL